jgi:4-hydroxy-tetrahydrodipicolinate synthase
MLTLAGTLRHDRRGKAKDCRNAREIYNRLLPVTEAAHHRGLHMEGTAALKHGLVARRILEHATLRSSLLPLEPGAEEESDESMYKFSFQ